MLSLNSGTGLAQKVRVSKYWCDKRNGKRHLPEGCLALSKCNDVVRSVRSLQDPQGYNIGPGLEKAHSNLLV